MSAGRSTDRLLRLYPTAWRERYGAELAALIMDSTDGQRVPWRTRMDVAVSAIRERLRAVGLSGDGPPAEQARDGTLLVLLAWALFVVAGCGVQKVSEHWQAATPAADRGLPALAFTTLVATAVVGGVIVLAGAALAFPGLRDFLRAGGWARVRGPVVVASALTGVGVVATVGIVALARTVTDREGPGHGALDTAAFVAWGLVIAACVLAWTGVAVTTARRLPWPAPVLRVEVWLAVAVTAAMTLMTAATLLWWVEVARSASWFFTGRPVGHGGNALAPLMVASVVTMGAATLLGLAGSRRALHGLPGLCERGHGEPA